jgi:hypothetical protein
VSDQVKSDGLFRSIRTFSFGVWLYLIAWFILQFAFAGVYAVLLHLFLRRMGFPIEYIGLVSSAAALGFALFAIPAGGFGARWGYKKMILIGLIAGTFFTALIPFTIFLPMELSKFIIVPAYGLFAVAMTLIAVNGIPFLAANSTDKSRVAVFSAYASVAPLAGFAGSLLGGFLPSIISGITRISSEKPDTYAFSLWIVPLLLIVFVFLFLFFIKESHSQEAAADKTIHEKAPVYLFIIFFIFTLFRIATFWSIFAFFSIYLDSIFHIPTEAIGIITAIGRLIPAVIALLTPMIAKKLGKFKLVILVSIASTLMALPMGLIASVFTAAFSLIMVSALNAIDASIFATFQQEATPVRWRPLMSGSCFAAEAASFSLVAVFGGLIIKGLGYQPFFLITTAMTFTSTFIFWFFLRKKYSKT